MSPSSASGSESRNWAFRPEQIQSSPSRRSGVGAAQETLFRQQSAVFISEMGERLNLSQLCINTGIVYMHRFYMVQSFTCFHRNVIAPAALLLASKNMGEPRPVEHVAWAARSCLYPKALPLDYWSDACARECQYMVALMNTILQSLGSDVAVDHPHKHIVECLKLVQAPMVVPQVAYLLATNSLLATTFCLQYRPSVVACVCIHLACKWANWEIPVTSEGKHWWQDLDPTVTREILEELSDEILQIWQKTPDCYKCYRNWKARGQTQNQEGSDQDIIMNMIYKPLSACTLAGLMCPSSREKNCSPTANAQQQQIKSLSPSERRVKSPTKRTTTVKNVAHMEAKVKQECTTAVKVQQEDISSSCSSASESRKRAREESGPSETSHPAKMIRLCSNSDLLLAVPMPLAPTVDLLPAVGPGQDQERHSQCSGQKDNTTDHSVVHDSISLSSPLLYAPLSP